MSGGGLVSHSEGRSGDSGRPVLGEGPEWHC